VLVCWCVDVLMCVKRVSNSISPAFIRSIPFQTRRSLTHVDKQHWWLLKCALARTSLLNIDTGTQRHKKTQRERVLFHRYNRNLLPKFMSTIGFSDFDGFSDSPQVVLCPTNRSFFDTRAVNTSSWVDTSTPPTQSTLFNTCSCSSRWVFVDPE
jgi:hypothetical protein